MSPEHWSSTCYNNFRLFWLLSDLVFKKNTTKHKLNMPYCPAYDEIMSYKLLYFNNKIFNKTGF